MPTGYFLFADAMEIYDLTLQRYDNSAKHVAVSRIFSSLQSITRSSCHPRRCSHHLVSDVRLAINASNKSSGVPTGGVDVARHFEVLDGSILDVAEEGRTLVAVICNRGRAGVGYIS